jgi:ubiquinone/menaquinone biosynthesis C-methylase UbiE
MGRRQSNLDFRGMALVFRIRDYFAPRQKIIHDIDIKPGYHVLDYGCGPGGYIPAVAEMVGPSGMIYAADVHPLAQEYVENIAARYDLGNVRFIHTDCDTGLADRSIDVVLLFDILHDLGSPDRVLGELSRVLKPDGILFASDHHLVETELIKKIEGSGLFQFSGKGKYVYSFVPVLSEL